MDASILVAVALVIGVAVFSGNGPRRDEKRRNKKNDEGRDDRT